MEAAPAAVEAAPAGARSAREAPPKSAHASPIRRRSLAERLAEPKEHAVSMPAAAARARSRRDFLLFGAGALAAAGGLWWLLPDETRAQHLTPALREKIDSLEARLGATSERREQFLDRTLTFDDDVAELSIRRTDPSARTPARRPRRCATTTTARRRTRPASRAGASRSRASPRDGPSGSRSPISSGGLRAATRSRASAASRGGAPWRGGAASHSPIFFEPTRPLGKRGGRSSSPPSISTAGRSDPYYVSIDLVTARHPQTLLATHCSGRPLPVEHGAPLRLVAPMKLGLKNIKAITSIELTDEEPDDDWNERGYSKYDGL